MQDRIKGLINKGLQAQKEGNFALALQYFKEAYQIAKKLNNPQLEARCLSLIESTERSKQLDDARRKKTTTSYEEGTSFKVIEDETTLERIIAEQKATEHAASDLFDLLGDQPDEGLSEVGKESEKVFYEDSDDRPHEPSKPAQSQSKLGKLKGSIPPLEDIIGAPSPRPTTPKDIPKQAAGSAPPEAPPGPPAYGVEGPPKQQTSSDVPSKATPGATPKPSVPTGGIAYRKPPISPPITTPSPSLPPTTSETSTPVKYAPELIVKEKKREDKYKPKKSPKADKKLRRKAKGNGGEISEEEGEEKQEEELKAEDDREAIPKKIKRFGDVSAPMEMTVKKEYLVNIGLRVFKKDVVGMPVPMTITVPKVGPPIVEVFVIGQDFKVDQPRRTLIVPLDTDSDILNFRVTPKKDGLRNLTVEFYQEGILIGRAILKIIVKKKREPVNEALSSTSVTVASQFHDSKLDATLRIVRYENDFFFSLFTPRAKAVVSQSALFGKSSINLSKLHQLEAKVEDTIFDRGNPRAALDRLKALGAQIYNSIPKQIQKTIQLIKPKYLMIETGDLLVPWEIAYDGYDFLCSKYCLGKRVFDETRDFRPPPLCIGKKILDVVFIGASPKGVPEISVDTEVDLFNVYEQTKRIQLQKLVEPNALKIKVLESLKDGDLIHLTCHGHFDEHEPLESALLLSDGTITANEIDDLEINKWPLIFANACSTGAISDKVVGIGGIARSFLEAGAIAFLGPLFEIPDDIAIEFAKEFYNNLLYNGENLGEAIINTRKKLKEKFGGAFWATFSLYGDPTLNLCKA